MILNLGINTGFAVNRFSEHSEWTSLIKRIGLRDVQLTADMLNVSYPEQIVSKQTTEILKNIEKNDLRITSLFTGAFTRVNHLAHPDKDIQEYWIKWFERFIDLSSNLGSRVIGSHFGIFTSKDNSNPQLREERRKQNIKNWHKVGEYAAMKGLDHIAWEPMSISREQGETLEECEKLQRDVNINSPIPFKICLDVDHGDLSSKNPDDTNPHKWIEKFANESSMIHLKQSHQNKGGHWPFTKEHNEIGKIDKFEIKSSLEKTNTKEIDLILELSFRERQPFDSTVEESLHDSVEYWKEVI